MSVKTFALLATQSALLCMSAIAQQKPPSHPSTKVTTPGNLPISGKLVDAFVVNKTKGSFQFALVTSKGDTVVAAPILTKSKQDGYHTWAPDMIYVQKQSGVTAALAFMQNGEALFTPEGKTFSWNSAKACPMKIRPFDAHVDKVADQHGRKPSPVIDARLLPGLSVF